MGRARSKRNTIHAYTTTKVEENKAIVRLSTFFVLLSLLFIDSNWDIELPETLYILLVGAILGVDIPALTRKFLKKF
jgi:hypothetical protein